MNAYRALHLYLYPETKVDYSTRQAEFSIRPVCSPSPATAVENSAIITLSLLS